LLPAVAGQPALLVVLLNTFRFQRYLLVPERNAIHMVLHAEAQSRDMMQAYLQVRTQHMIFSPAACWFEGLCCVWYSARNAIHMVLHAEAQSRDMMQAYLQVASH
jgi:hypothetical protein